MKLRGFRRSTLGGESGQILTEAAIGLSLMSMAWILTSFVSFMATNHLRTVMAARYAAWYRGEALEEASTNQIRNYFFYHDLVGVEYGPGVGMLDLDSNLETVDKEKLRRAASGPFLATVRFGITGPESAGAMQVPFSLLWAQLPFMPVLAPEGGTPLSLASSCQWEETGNPWNEPDEALSWIWERLKALASMARGALDEAF